MKRTQKGMELSLNSAEKLSVEKSSRLQYDCFTLYLGEAVEGFMATWLGNYKICFPLYGNK